MDYKKLTIQIREQFNNEAILNAQSSIVLLTNGKQIISINELFFKEFDFIDIDDFTSKHKCICELFLKKNSIPHLQPIMDGINWIEYINQNKNISFKAYMNNKNKNERIYEVKTSSKLFENEEVNIVVFNDITLLQQQSNQLQVQSKFNSVGKMISMIAHQWRQPLARISSFNANTKLKQSLGVLENSDINEMLEKQNEQIQYMNTIINDFSTLFKDTR